MATYSLTLIDRPLASIEGDLCRLLEVESLIPAAEASEGDLLVWQSPDGWTLLDGRDSLSFSAGIPKCETQLTELALATGSHIRSIAVQTSVGYVHLLVLDSGRVMRRFETGEGVISIDEGRLPAWEAQIERDPVGAANNLIGLAYSDPASDPAATPGSPHSASADAEAIPGAQAARLLTLDADLGTKPHSSISFAPPERAIPVSQVTSEGWAEVVGAEVRQGALVLDFATGDSRRVRLAEIGEVKQNPFTGQPLLIAQNGQVWLLPDALGDEVWSLLERWAGHRLVRPVSTPVQDIPVVVQLAPLLAAAAGAVLGALKSWAVDSAAWGREGLIDSVGAFAGAGFILGSVVLVAYLAWKYCCK